MQLVALKILKRLDINPVLTQVTHQLEKRRWRYKNRGCAKLKIYSYLVTMVTHKLESKYQWYEKRECKG